MLRKAICLLIHSGGIISSVAENNTYKLGLSALTGVTVLRWSSAISHRHLSHATNAATTRAAVVETNSFHRLIWSKPFVLVKSFQSCLTATAAPGKTAA